MLVVSALLSGFEEIGWNEVNQEVTCTFEDEMTGLREVLDRSSAGLNVKEPSRKENGHFVDR